MTDQIHAPWTLSQCNDHAVEITDDRGDIVAREEFNAEDPIYLKSGQQAQFAYIVTCVNAHAALADAVQQLLKAYEQLMPGVGGLFIQDLANLNTAPLAGDRALRLAKGKP